MRAIVPRARRAPLIVLLGMSAVLLGYAAWSKGASLDRFTAELRSHAMLPAGFEHGVALAVVGCESAMAAACALGTFRVGLRPIASALLAGFLVSATCYLAAVAMVRGIRVPCGCLGRESSVGGGLVRNAILLATVAGCMAVLPRRDVR